jgi:hypothetical protein
LAWVTFEIKNLSRCYWGRNRQVQLLGEVGNVGEDCNQDGVRVLGCNLDKLHHKFSRPQPYDGLGRA